MKHAPKPAKKMPPMADKPMPMGGKMAAGKMPPALAMKIKGGKKGAK